MMRGTSNLAQLDDLSQRIDYSIVGPRDNRVHEIDTERFPFNTVCHVGRDFGQDRWSGCSGVLIGRCLVLTAAHCLFSHIRGRAPKRIRVSPGRLDSKSFPFGSQLAVRAYVPEDFIRARGPASRYRKLADYGVVVLGRPFARIRRFMKLRALRTDQLQRLMRQGQITVAGYPGDRPVGSMWRHSERLARVTPRRLLYTVDTCPGHSGSPIWCQGPDGKDATIIGVHTSGIVDELGRSYGCKKGTVLAPPGMMNSGVRITPGVLANIRDPTRRVDGQRIMVRTL